MMSTIQSIAHIVAVLRKEMARPAIRNAIPPPRGRPAPATRAAQQGQITALIIKRVEAIHPDDAERGRKAIRILLESILLNQFGSELSGDPAFYQMVDQVQQQLESDPALSTLLRNAIEQLLPQAPSQAPD